MQRLAPALQLLVRSFCDLGAEFELTRSCRYWANRLRSCGELLELLDGQSFVLAKRLLHLEQVRHCRVAQEATAEDLLDVVQSLPHLTRVTAGIIGDMRATSQLTELTRQRNIALHLKASIHADLAQLSGMRARRLELDLWLDSDHEFEAFEADLQGFIYASTVTILHLNNRSLLYSSGSRLDGDFVFLLDHIAMTGFRCYSDSFIQCINAARPKLSWQLDDAA